MSRLLRAAALFALVASTAGCADGEGVVVVTLATAENIPPYTEFDLAVTTSDGKVHRAVYPLPARANGPIHTTLSFTFPPALQGAATLDVAAYDGNNPVAVSTMTIPVTLTASKETDVTVPMTALPPSGTASCIDTANCYLACTAGDTACHQACADKAVSPQYATDANTLANCVTTAETDMNMNQCGSVCSDPNGVACTGCLWGTCSGTPPSETCDGSRPCGNARATCDNDIAPTTM